MPNLPDRLFPARSSSTRDAKALGAKTYGYRWERARAWFLRRYPLCGDRPASLPPRLSVCRADGQVTPATVVDHVVPHRGDPGLFWDRTNWQALCASCHARKTRMGL